MSGQIGTGVDGVYTPPINKTSEIPLNDGENGIDKYISAKDNEISNESAYSSLKVIDLSINEKQAAPKSFKDILDENYKPLDNALPFIKESTANRFEVYMPTNRKGYYDIWRFVNNNVPSVGLTNPFLSDLVRNSYLEAQKDYLGSTGVFTGTWTTASSIIYSVTANDTAVLSAEEGTSILFTYRKDFNHGIAYIKVDGKNPPELPVDEFGNAYIDMYAASLTNASVIFAGLEDTAHTVEMTVSGLKNDLSTGFRVNTQYTQTSIRTYSGYIITEPTEYEYTDEYTATIQFYYSPAGSARNYALAFRPNDMPGATTPFLGDAHGYENLTSLEFYFDGVLTPFPLDTPFDKIKTFENLEIKQVQQITHPDDFGNYFIETSVSHYFTKGDKYRRTYQADILEDIFLTNGYTEMFVAQGGNLGGNQNDPNGWCDRGLFRGFKSYNIQKKNLDETSGAGHHLANEIVFWGSSKKTTEPNRDDISGSCAIVVNINDLNGSLDYYQNPLAKTDAVWINSRDNLKKMYCQAFRGKGLMSAGYSFKGDMSVSLYNIFNLNYYTDPSGLLNAIEDIKSKTLKAVATLNFPSTAVGAKSDLLVNVPGAVMGEVVTLGIPHASIQNGGTFTAWVDKPDSVTIRFLHNDPVNPIDPPEGIFTIKVLKD